MLVLSPPRLWICTFLLFAFFLDSFLVYFILNFFDIFAPACAAAAALVALLRRRAQVTSSGLRHDGAPVVPGVAGLRVVLCIA